MMGKRLFLFILLGIALAGCKDTTELVYTPPVFRDTLCVQATVLNDTFIMNGANDMFLYKDYLILSTRVDDYQFHIFDKFSGRHLKSFGAIGRGPGEIFYVDPVTLDQSTGDLIAVRINVKTAIVYNIDSVLQSGQAGYRDVSFEHLPPFLQALYWNQRENIFLAEGRGGEENMKYRFMRLDEKGKITETYSEYPEDIKAPFEPNLFTTYSVRSFSPDGKRLAEGLQKGAVLEILDMRDSICRHAIKRFYRPELIRQDNCTTSPLDAVKGFRDIAATNDCIYTIFQGNRNLSLARNMCVFDWDGNPLQLYHTEYNLICICFDESYHRMYAVVYNENNETILVSFDLSQAVKRSYPPAEDIEKPWQPEEMKEVITGGQG